MKHKINLNTLSYHSQTLFGFRKHQRPNIPKHLFANLLHQLVNSKPANPKRSNLLVSRIHEKKQSAEWRWLLEKAKALKST